MAAKQVQLENGVTYRGRIIASLIATEGMVKDRFTKVGFKDVQVWTDEPSVPADWPAEARGNVASFGDKQIWVQGTWDKTTGMYPGEGTGWEIYDYWPKDNAKPIAVGDAPKTPTWIYGAVAGGAALVAVILIVATSSKD
jgi:hypothetical protein